MGGSGSTVWKILKELVLRSLVSGRRFFYYVVDGAPEKLKLIGLFDFKGLTCEYRVEHKFDWSMLHLIITWFFTKKRGAGEKKQEL